MKSFNLITPVAVIAAVIVMGVAINGTGWQATDSPAVSEISAPVAAAATTVPTDADRLGDALRRDVRAELDSTVAAQYAVTRELLNGS